MNQRECLNLSERLADETLDRLESEIPDGHYLVVEINVMPKRYSKKLMEKFGDETHVFENPPNETWEQLFKRLIRAGKGDK